LTAKGTVPTRTDGGVQKGEKNELVLLNNALQSAIRNAGRSTVARLVMDEQRRYWRENPEQQYLHNRQWNSYIYSWRYRHDPSFRRQECQRNSEKKARNRNNHTVKLCRGDIDARFAEFNNQCAYCGSGDQLIIEHFIPRSKGGPHAIGNILPACHNPCNMSKFNHDPEEWYRSRSYFSETRWRKILRVLGKGKAEIHQLPLL
jgi:5-methylcytosine-specific restriction endonuclease McrA